MDLVNRNQIFRRSTCPWGKKAVALLKERNIDFHDHVFSSREEEDALKAKLDAQTTPQVYLDGQLIGGYDDLAEHFAVAAEKPGTSYTPVIAVFGTAALLALAMRNGIMGFMGFSVTILACLKLMDIASFVKGFRQYDLLSQRVDAYAHVYPFAELGVGLAMLSGRLPLAAGVVALVIGTIGGISVFKTVYFEKKDLNCACVGGNSAVPLGTISFAENIMMIVMGVWLLLRMT